MKKTLLLLAVIALLVIGASVALAQGGESVDDQGNVNDPNVNERANACYEGGEWEGKCDTLLMWMGGWFRIRLDYGVMTEAELPPGFAWVASPVWSPEYPSAWCESIGGGYYVDFNGTYYVIEPPDYYDDNSCQNDRGSSSSTYVFAPEGYDALELCNSVGMFSSVNPAGDVFRCTP